MGDRVSIRFVNEEDKSPVLFSHWDGMNFVKRAKDYLKKLKKYVKKEGISMPLSRLEPRTVMVDFIRHITQKLDQVDCNYYLGLTEDDGDNSDNGHHDINLGKGE